MTDANFLAEKEPGKIIIIIGPREKLLVGRDEAAKMLSIRALDYLSRISRSAPDGAVAAGGLARWYGLPQVKIDTCSAQF
jgi:hypothetical protein